MQISSRFTIAIHILICVDLFGRDEPATSESLAGSIGAHPVVIRRILGQLRRAGLITVARGREGGAHIARPLEKITIADIFHAVESIGDDRLFSFHENPNPACPVGRNIHNILDGHLASIQQAMERTMESTTLADVIAEAREQMGEED
ncbi:Rrf2 family transcriptional regulator [uncultured Selenomonas sp.]|jgi:rrf2 family transcriptional regulator|uniref:Rrf2 family transcriptional regulator n=1 Tax=uncultured Selenomonas sp. TaxID=159275 RepID=UPI0028EF5652|nr:Rrf2 family transcriptional regulator [uncultured Selenomonas sp.]